MARTSGKGGFQKPRPPKIGRPRNEVDPKMVYELAKNMNPMARIAVLCEVCVETLETHFSDIISKGYEETRAKLLEKQLEMAFKGDRTMMIWCGKQHLGQAERIHEESHQTQLVVNVNKIPD